MSKHEEKKVHYLVERPLLQQVRKDGTKDYEGALHAYLEHRLGEGYALLAVDGGTYIFRAV